MAQRLGLASAKCKEVKEVKAPAKVVPLTTTEANAILARLPALYKENEAPDRKPYEWIKARRAEAAIAQTKYKFEKLKLTPWFLFYGPTKLVKSCSKIYKKVKREFHIIRFVATLLTGILTGVLGGIKGAALGSAIPIVGTILGAIIGALVGMNSMAIVANVIKARIDSGHSNAIALREKLAQPKVRDSSNSWIRTCLIEHIQESRTTIKLAARENNCYLGTAPYSNEGLQLRKKKQLQQLVLENKNPYTDPSFKALVLSSVKPVATQPIDELAPLLTAEFNDEERAIADYLRCFPR